MWSGGCDASLGVLGRGGGGRLMDFLLAALVRW